MGSTAVHPEVIRAEVVGVLGVGVDAVDSRNKPVGQGLAAIRMALAGRWRRQLLAIDLAALADRPTIEARRLTPWLGRQNEQQFGVDNCPDGITGELRLGGRGTARGYRGSPNPAAARFVEPDVRVWCRTELAAAAADMNPAVLSVVRGVGWPRARHVDGGQPPACRAWID